MSDFGYDKLKYSYVKPINTDPNTKEGREVWWDSHMGRKLRRIYIEMDTDGLIDMLKLKAYFDNIHYLATKEMKQAFLNSDYFKETMTKYREILMMDE